MSSPRTSSPPASVIPSPTPLGPVRESMTPAC
jgi:hypothetical protein